MVSIPYHNARLKYSSKTTHRHVPNLILPPFLISKIQSKQSHSNSDPNSLLIFIVQPTEPFHNCSTFCVLAKKLILFSFLNRPSTKQYTHSPPENPSILIPALSQPDFYRSHSHFYQETFKFLLSKKTRQSCETQNSTRREYFALDLTCSLSLV
jgi:hypothetical protein